MSLIHLRNGSFAYISIPHLRKERKLDFQKSSIFLIFGIQDTPKWILLEKGQHCNLGIFNRPTIGSLDVFEGEKERRGSSISPHVTRDWESNKWHFSAVTLCQLPRLFSPTFEAFHCLGKYLPITENRQKQQVTFWCQYLQRKNSQIKSEKIIHFNGER